MQISPFSRVPWQVSVINGLERHSVHQQHMLTAAVHQQHMLTAAVHMHKA
jgi:hypothetical protein